MKEHRTDDGVILGWLALLIGRSRFIVLVSVIAVLLGAITLFLLGTVQAIQNVVNVWADLFAGVIEAPDASVEFLKIVIVMLEAVVFFLVGVGLYSLFIAPLNVAVALGVETLNDLEEKVTSVVVVILSVTFVEHFIRWENPLETLQFGGALAVTVIALFAFQLYSHRAKKDQVPSHPEESERSRRELFHEREELHEIPDGDEK